MLVLTHYVGNRVRSPLCGINKMTRKCFPVRTRTMLVAAVMLFFGRNLALCQQELTLPDAPQTQQLKIAESSTTTSEYQQHHIMWVIPNYRTDEGATEFIPLTPDQKFRMAFDDSFDPTAFLVAGVFAGTSMAEDQYRPFGQGAKGFSKYYGGAFADQAIGNVMSEALFPTVLHQDPRYFTKAHGGFWRRAGYAISREFVTYGDDGAKQFNTSELAGNAVAAGISNLYYPAADRSLGKTANKWVQQISLDTAFNIMKEFWPDVRRKFFGH